MTSWILVVGEGFDENWERAVDYQLWDLKKRTPIKRGDDIFFWQASNIGFRGWARAASDAASGDLLPRPWIEKDTADYVQRFHFDVVSDSTVPGRWGDLVKKEFVKAGPNTAPIAVTDPHAATHLRGLFLPRIDVAKLPPSVELDLTQFPDYLSDEDRRRMKKLVAAVREGRSTFRASLIAAYAGRCAVSGVEVVPVLEAAHIARYRGPHSNQVSNGLLLRSDIHTLFDAHRIAIASDLHVKVDPQLQNTSYWQFDGQPLDTPANPQWKPNSEALSRHFERCTWTS